MEHHRLLAMTYQLTSFAYAYGGRPDRGLEDARRGLELSREKGYWDSSYAWLLCNAGMNYWGLGKVPDAIRYAEDALKQFQSNGSKFGEACTYLSLAVISMYTGRMDRAEDMARACLDAAVGLDMPGITGPAGLVHSYALMKKGRFIEAKAALDAASEAAAFSSYFQGVALRVRAFLKYLQGGFEEALEDFRKSLLISETHRHEWWFAKDEEIVFPLVVLYSRGVMQDYILKVLSMAGSGIRENLTKLLKGADPDAAQAIAEILRKLPGSSQPGLRVQCLGTFRVFKGGAEIPAESWKSSRSRMLFKLLVHYRKRGFISKEVLIEHLWPEDDPAKTASRFHVALTTLRRILEPDLKRGFPSAYLKADGDSYLLDLGEDGFVDLEAFEEACLNARTVAEEERAAEHLVEAGKLYRGDFLAEDLYVPWCMEERDRIKGLHLSVLSGLVEYHISRRDYARAADYCGAYLAADAYAEDIYQQQMRLYALLGNNAMVLKTFDRCRDMIVVDLGCPLSRRTESLARELIGYLPEGHHGQTRGSQAR
jgi:DNA-binding SARP family transcriptional activator